MTRETLSKCLGFVENMHSNQGWNASLVQMYSVVLQPMSDTEGMAAVEHAFTHDNWRPSPARLIEIAAELAAPIPDADACYDEIAHLAETVGLYGATDPDHPNIHQIGIPSFSHPVVRRIVNYCGGWAMICTGEANMAEGLRKQVRSSWQSVSGEWRERVREALKLPPDKRNPGLFRSYQRYRLPVGWTPATPAELTSVDELPQYDVDKRSDGGLTRFGR